MNNNLVVENLVDVKLYHEITHRIYQLLKPDTFNLFFYIPNRGVINGINSSNIIVNQSNIILNPNFFTLIYKYLSIKISPDMYSLCEYCKYSNYINLKTSGDVEYLIFSMNPISVDILPESLSEKDCRIMTNPTNTGVIVSVPYISVESLFKPFKDIIYNNFNL